MSIVPGFLYHESRICKEIREAAKNATNDEQLGFAVRRILQLEYIPKENNSKKEETDFEKYMQYAKTITDKFAEILSLQNDLTDYANLLHEQNPNVFINFRPSDRSLIEMMLDGSWNQMELMERIEARQEFAKLWLRENLLTFEEWKQHKK